MEGQPVSECQSDVYGDYCHCQHERYKTVRASDKPCYMGICQNYCEVHIQRFSDSGVYDMHMQGA